MNRTTSIIFLALCITVFSYSATKKGNNNLSKETTPVEGWIEHALQGFNMRVWLNNKMTMGMQAWDGRN